MSDAHAQSAAATATYLPSPNRLGSLDAYRGFVMLLMMGEVLSFGKVADLLAKAGLPVGLWGFLGHQQEHVSWVGGVLHDLIQPSFSFLVGAALPFSLAARAARGQGAGRLTLHAVWRALLLTLLGVALRSTGSSHTNWTLEDTLSQIGLGYVFLFLVGQRSVRVQWIAFAAILIGYWAAFALYPLPGADFDYPKVGVSAAWLQENGLPGFAAHWQKNSNFAWAADKVILNAFPRPTTWEFNRGGYATLSFIPTLGTMILGLIAGGVLQGNRTPGAKVKRLVVAGVACLALGWTLDALGICPVVKRIWTPSWVLYSGGICLLFLAGFYAVLDVGAVRGWAFFLRVVGLNSIAAYCIAHLWEGFISRNLVTHLGEDFFRLAGDAYQPFFIGATVLLVEWLILFWMYRRKLFLRI
jgi:predicted acyltransferase